MGTVANITLDKINNDTGNPEGNAITIYCTKIEKTWNKKYGAFTPPVTSANWSNGAKPTKIIDFLRVEKRWTVTGDIDDTDESNFEAMMGQGGVVRLRHNSTNFDVNLDKHTITKVAREDDHLSVMFTATQGENF